jgi:hypothetical protein
MKPNVAPVVRTEELNGLNWQVHVDPVTLSTTTLPPTLPVLTGVVEVPDPDELLDELPPQAVTRMHTAASAISHWKRFIDTLSSRYLWGPKPRSPGQLGDIPEAINRHDHLGNT